MLDTFPEMFGDSSTIMLELLVFLATAVLSFGIIVGLRSRGAIKRRAAGIAEHSGDVQDPGALRSSSLKLFSACSITPPKITPSRKKTKAR
jgi:hypothetical protein